ncbi:conserved hypothetical protein [Gloeothece citriformis PCC 7424]|uniref:2-oxoadipate dioxygenase/decarboxylase n=1 Tax=Gloeothece citriformis (strain PCC 7424) TaxID=65393 RepID=B7K948_GLOC7|nr:DUF1338 domain-containing protein [Gloeothece citriformis]ACK72817.1 conserved hypothetical protein [Gloeothece citriformis PCC 7424]
MNYSELAGQLWDCLWEVYRQRVIYARIYEQMIEEAGGRVKNDHIAFRSLRLTIKSEQGEINLGIPYLAQVVEKLGYVVKGEYHFPDSHLYACHYQHPEQDVYDLPKLFISELIVDELPDSIAQQIKETVETGNFFKLDQVSFDGEKEQVLTQLQQVFTRPWTVPKRSIIQGVNEVSQYGAWVLIHGYGVNHFTGYVNHQNTSKYPDIETTAKGLADLGVPMKATIEGSLGSGLRQTATHAVTEMVTVKEDTTGELIQIPWTYAYYEIAERNIIEVEASKRILFEGFLDAQAKNLFEMTRKS